MAAKGREPQAPCRLLWRKALRPGACTLELALDGAMPQLRAATDPQARGGELYGPRYVNTGPAVRLPTFRPGANGAIAILWQVSERETGIPLRIA